MYKVMLVDDEKLITQGLLNIIEWDKLELKVTQIANNGEEAFEKFQKDPVDIIITDINMPKLTGLDLLKKITNINNKTKFIILSGYDEFSYAKTAIEYGVESYILKPIDEEELENVLKKIVLDISDEKIKESKILNKNRILFQYLNKKILKEELINIKDYLNISLENKNYTVAILMIIKKNEKDLFTPIDTIAKSIFGNEYEILHKYDGQVVLINSWNKDFTSDQIKNYYIQIKDKIINELNEEVFISIGDLVCDVNEIEISYKIANALKKYMLTEGVNICLDRHSLNYTEEYNRTFNNEIEKINKLIIEKNIDVLEEYVNEILDNKKLNPKNIYDLSIKILFLIDKTLEEFKLNRKYRNDSLSNIIVKLCNESTRENVKSFVLSELKELIELMDDNNRIKYSPVVQQVISIVNEKYYEELSLKTLAQKYNVNSSYLGQIFNKEVGVSFSEYLNKIKNTKAKELILNTNMKINDIAKSVGYIDTSYFYRKFKKYFGVSPSTIRDMKRY